VNNGQEWYDKTIKPIESQIMRSIWRITRNKHDAEDAMQSALEIIWKKRRKLLRHPNARALILRICIHAAYDTLRRCVRIRNREEMDAIRTDMPDSSAHPDRQVEASDSQEQILRLIGRLRPNQSQAILMRYMHGLSYAEIASSLGCRETAARKIVERARNRLVEWMPALQIHN
jgi:RNA polymerase sigma-70 factor (ECF subfamily)